MRREISRLAENAASVPLAAKAISSAAAMRHDRGTDLSLKKPSVSDRNIAVPAKSGSSIQYHRRLHRFATTTRCNHADDDFSLRHPLSIGRY